MPKILSVLLLLLMGALSMSIHAAEARTLVSGLNYPWDIEAYGDDFYITEKSGNLGVIHEGQLTRMSVVTSVPILDSKGGGLLGMALFPNFSETQRVALYQHYGSEGQRRNRVIEVVRDGNQWRETRVLLDNIPGHPLYNGGRVAFGPDGMLYISTGWTENRSRPQDLKSLAGKILRIKPDGSIPADNPFPDSPVWSLGHRNPQGIAWDNSGQLFNAEHGQSGHDEVNRVQAGANYGWPLIQGDNQREGMQRPLAHSGYSTWAPSGLAYDGKHLVVAALRSQGILLIDPDTGKMVQSVSLGERIRDLLVKEGVIYAITTNLSPRYDGDSDDRLIRVSID